MPCCKIFGWLSLIPTDMLEVLVQGKVNVNVFSFYKCFFVNTKSYAYLKHAMHISSCSLFKQPRGIKHENFKFERSCKDLKKKKNNIKKKKKRGKKTLQKKKKKRRKKKKKRIRD